MVRWFSVCSSLVLLLSCGTTETPRPRAQPRPAEGAEAGARTAATLVLVGGKVHTLDPAQPTATAVAIAGDRIVEVGTDEAVGLRIGPNTKVIDLGGKTVLPGLADAHLHLFGLGSRGRIVDLTATRSIKDVRDRVAAAAKGTSAGAWVQGRGWDQNDWGTGGAWPTARDLDQATRDVPVILWRVDGHAVWVNTKAMELAGVGRDVRDPPGGRVIRGPGGPSGVFVDNAMALVESAVPPPTPSDLRRAYFLGEREALKSGLTQVHDMGLGRAELAILRDLDKAGELKLRIYALLDGSVEDLDAMMGAGPQVPAADSPSMLTVRGVKFYLDGALGSRGAALLAPYSDEPKTSGLVVMDEQLFEARVKSAKERGYQVATHAIGDRANRLALDVYERVFGQRATRDRPRIEHAQVIARDDLSRFQQLGVIASMQPTHATSDMPWAEKRVGPERIQGAYAWRSLVVGGATLAAGSDAPVEEVSVIAGLYAAIHRQSPDEFMAEPWRGEEALSPLQAVRAFSQGAAYASFREADVGRVSPGMVADLTVLDVDPMAADAAALSRGKAELTIVGGALNYIRPGADRAPEPKVEAKPEPKVEAKPEPKVEAKPEPKVEAKPALEPVRTTTTATTAR
jgi:predicted amidohydrolase YtcJ